MNARLATPPLKERQVICSGGPGGTLTVRSLWEKLALPANAVPAVSVDATGGYPMAKDRWLHGFH